MAYLKGLGLSNFRGFKDEQIEFAPITILTGPNNSGKSSLIKALLLLRDNINRGSLPPTYIQTASDSSGTNEVFAPSVFHFDGEIHGLGNAMSAKSWGSENEEMSFIIPYVVHQETLFYKLTSYIEKDRAIATTTHKVLLLTSQQEILLKITDHEVYFSPRLYNELVKSEKDKLFIPQEIQERISESFGVSLSDWFSTNGFDDSEVCKKLAKNVYQTLKLNDGKSGSIECRPVYEHLKALDYWATSRNEQRRSYPQRDNSDFTLMLREFNNRRSSKESEKLFDGILDIFGIKEELRLSYRPEEGVYFPNFDGKSLLNFGFGYTQILALILKIALHGSNNHFYDNFGGQNLNLDYSMLMLEEPETNLHPNWQTKLADLFQIAVHKYKTQFLIETHSEYLIWRLQYLVLKGDLKPEDVVIYYFKGANAEQKEPFVKKINIRANGRLSGGFGKGFIDETGRLMASLLTGEYTDN